MNPWSYSLEFAFKFVLSDRLAQDIPWGCPKRYEAVWSQFYAIGRYRTMGTDPGSCPSGEFVALKL